MTDIDDLANYENLPIQPPDQDEENLGRVENYVPSPLPQRSKLCKHYESIKHDHIESAVQTLQTRIFNRTKKILAAIANRPYEEPVKYSFSTQTAAFHTEYEQTNREACTQPYNPILYGSERVQGEYTMYANADRYETAEQYFIRREAAVKKIQSCWRRYKSQLYCVKLRELHRAKEEQQQREEDDLDAEKEREREYELKRRIQPRTKADFDLLYQEVATWVRQRKFTIEQAQLIPEAREAALELLVQKESRLLQNIEALRRQTGIILKQDKIAAFFKKISEPRRWQLWDGSYAQVHTPYTLRAQSLRNCYYALEQTDVSLDQRLDILLQTKFIMKEFDCELTRNAVRLIDEEADLLSRNRTAESMQMLRKRIQDAFLDFCESPEFNPGVLTLVKDSNDLIYRPNTLPIIDKQKLTAAKKEQLNRVKQEQLRKAVYSQLDQTKEKINMIEVLGEVCGGEQVDQLDAECEVDEPGYFLNLLAFDDFLKDGVTISIIQDEMRDSEEESEQEQQNDSEALQNDEYGPDVVVNNAEVETAAVIDYKTESNAGDDLDVQELR